MAGEVEKAMPVSFVKAIDAFMAAAVSGNLATITRSFGPSVAYIASTRPSNRLIVSSPSLVCFSLRL